MPRDGGFGADYCAGVLHYRATPTVLLGRNTKKKYKRNT